MEKRNSHFSQVEPPDDSKQSYNIEQWVQGASNQKHVYEESEDNTRSKDRERYKRKKSHKEDNKKTKLKAGLNGTENPFLYSGVKPYPPGVSGCGPPCVVCGCRMPSYPSCVDACCDNCCNEYIAPPPQPYIDIGYWPKPCPSQPEFSSHKHGNCKSKPILIRASDVNVLKTVAELKQGSVLIPRPASVEVDDQSQAYKGNIFNRPRYSEYLTNKASRASKYIQSGASKIGDKIKSSRYSKYITDRASKVMASANTSGANTPEPKSLSSNEDSRSQQKRKGKARKGEKPATSGDPIMKSTLKNANLSNEADVFVNIRRPGSSSTDSSGRLRIVRQFYVDNNLEVPECLQEPNYSGPVFLCTFIFLIFAILMIKLIEMKADGLL